MINKLHTINAPNSLNTTIIPSALERTLNLRDLWEMQVRRGRIASIGLFQPWISTGDPGVVSHSLLIYYENLNTKRRLDGMGMGGQGGGGVGGITK
jgi:hypothetical protein